MFPIRLLFRNYLLKRVTRREFHAQRPAMAKVGDRLPSMVLFEDSPENEINIRELAANKKIIIFGVHGAFTPDCSKIHLPGFVVSANYLKSILNIHEIICISVNDPFVMSVWGEEHGASGKIRMLADPSGDFVKVMDLAMDLPTLGGIRSKRFSMIVGDTKVLKLNVEPGGAELGCSLARNIVKN